MEPTYQLTKKQEFFRKNIDSFVKQKVAPRLAETEAGGEFPAEILKHMADNGLLKLLVPKEQGGEGAGFLDFCLVLEGIAKVCPTSALACLTQNLGSKLVAVEGSPDQKEAHLQRVMKGDAVFGYVAPSVDVLSLDLAGTAVTFAEDAKGYVLNGPECNVINGDAADLVFVLAGNEKGAACFLVERGTPGFRTEIPGGSAGAEARCAPVGVFETCSVPGTSMLRSAGRGRELATDFLCEASVFTAALALGIAQGALEYAVQYSKQREQFGSPVSKFQAVRILVAGMDAKTEAMRHLVYKAASLLDQKSRDRYRIGSIAKSFAARMAMETATDAVQVAGGYGYMKDYPLQKMMRYAQLTQVLNGSDHSHELAAVKGLLG